MESEVVGCVPKSNEYHFRPSERDSWLTCKTAGGGHRER